MVILSKGRVVRFYFLNFIYTSAPTPIRRMAPNIIIPVISFALFSKYSCAASNFGFADNTWILPSNKRYLKIYTMINSID